MRLCNGRWVTLSVDSLPKLYRHLLIIEIGFRHNRDSWDSPLDAPIRGLPLVHRHCPTRMGNPCMHGLLLHPPGINSSSPAFGGARRFAPQLLLMAGGVQQQPAHARSPHAREAMPVHEREPSFARRAGSHESRWLRIPISIVIKCRVRVFKTLHLEGARGHRI